jgi:hypothetical protein
MTYTLLHPQAQRALEVLSDPVRTEELQLVPGKAAGIRELNISQFPPCGIHASKVPARFIFTTPEDRRFELQMMVYGIIGGGQDEILVLGIIAHDQYDVLVGRRLDDVGGLSDEQRWVAVRYSPVRRTGQVYVNTVVDAGIRLYQTRMFEAGNHRAITFTDANEM